MPVISFNGTSYTIPVTNDENWGDNVTTFLVSIPSGCLQPNSTSFTLTTGNVSFGATYGLVSKLFQSVSANPSATGAVRLSNTDSLSWRNGTNTADLALSVSPSNQLLYNGAPIVSSGGTAWGLITGTLTDQTDLVSALAAVTAIGLKSATTSVSVNAATAPSAGQVLTATNSTTATWQTPGVAGHVIEEEGTPLTQRANLNFVGPGLTAADSGGKTVVTLARWQEDQYTASGATAIFTLTQTPKDSIGVFAYINGVFRQQTVDYTQSGVTMTFTFTPNLNDLVTFKYQY